MGKRSKFMICYNVLNAILWSFILFISSKYVFYKHIYHIEQFWDNNKLLVTAVQSLAILELIFSILGLTKSIVSIVITQLFSRLYAVYLIFNYLPSNNQWILGCLISWSIIEIIRYIFYTLKQLDIEFYVLTSLRKKSPIILYPTGICSEVVCIFSSLNNIYESKELRTFPWPMPNNLNFQIDIYYVTICILFLYIPGSILMYSSAIKRSRSKYELKDKEV